ncbi:MAG: Rrf2 family transcriptional regulator [Deltaproteobacteria bacterium]|nr:Rrf2 family transcriptional regulator [Deltaproteobacteria bacterium]
MAANSRFAVAVHAATVLAFNGSNYVTSDLIAESVNTNPVVVRRIISALTKAGIVESHLGKSGGSRLAKKPNRITLLDIYQAVEKQGLFALNQKPENKKCRVSCCMKDILSRVFDAAEKSVEVSFANTTLADVLKPIS